MLREEDKEFKSMKKSDDNKSGQVNKSYVKSTLGGYPPKKQVEQIDKDTKPRSNGSAPGSVRK